MSEVNNILSTLRTCGVESCCEGVQDKVCACINLNIKENFIPILKVIFGEEKIELKNGSIRLLLEPSFMTSHNIQSEIRGVANLLGFEVESNSTIGDTNLKLVNGDMVFEILFWSGLNEDFYHISCN